MFAQVKDALNRGRDWAAAAVATAAKADGFVTDGIFLGIVGVCDKGGCRKEGQRNGGAWSVAVGMA